MTFVRQGADRRGLRASNEFAAMQLRLPKQYVREAYCVPPDGRRAYIYVVTIRPS